MMESLEGRTLMSASLPGAGQLSTRAGGEIVSQLELENTMISSYAAQPRPQTQGIIAILIG
jgi:hypothetical protein